jgi:hypothetical protein
MLIQILLILGVIILSPLALIAIIALIGFIIVGIQELLGVEDTNWDRDDYDMNWNPEAHTWNTVIEDLRLLLSSYYFHNEYPYDDRLRPMTDTEVLREVAELIENGEILN